MQGELENVRAALEWAGEKDPCLGLKLASAWWWFWYIRNYSLEGTRWLDYFLEMPQNDSRGIARGRALGRRAFLTIIDEYASTAASASESLSISSEIGDKPSEAFAYYVLGWVDYQIKRDFKSAGEQFEKSLAIYRSIGDTWGQARITLNLGNMASYQGDRESQRAYLEKSLALCQEAGDLRGMAIALDNLAFVITDQGDLQGGRKMVEEAIRIYRKLGASGAIGNALNVYRIILVWQGDYAGARAVLEEDMEISNQTGIQYAIESSKLDLGTLARWEGHFEQAAQILEDCLAQFIESGSMRLDLKGSILVELANVQMRMGNLSAAKSLLEEVLANSTDPWLEWEALLVSGLVETQQRKGAQAVDHIQQSLLIAQRYQSCLSMLLALEGLAGALETLARAEEATCILAAAAAFRMQIGAPIATGDKPRYDRLEAALQASLGEAAFARAWEKGQVLTLEDVVNSFGSRTPPGRP
jgi:tetratricopeptide (TPR) repeat protein